MIAPNDPRSPFDLAGIKLHRALDTERDGLMRNLLVFEAIQYLRAAGRNDLADRLVAGDDMQAICNEILWPAESAGEREAA